MNSPYPTLNPSPGDSERELLAKLMYGGVGQYVDPATYSPLGTSGDVAPPATDRATGARLALIRSLTPAVDGLRAHTPEPTIDTSLAITSTSTTFVNSDPIDLADYSQVTLFPNKTTGSVAGDALYKPQWSLDGTNWFDHVQYNAATGAMVALAGAGVTITTAVAAGYVPAAAVLSVPKQARYMRIAQQSKTAATHTVEYHIQLL